MARDYCCCAIPLFNVGIYAVLTEQFILGILAGTLAIATPHIVGAATPSFAAAIFAVVCYVGAAIQVLGYIGVSKERPQLFKRYTQLHLIVLLLGFAVSLAWVGISASRHSTAKKHCVNDFFEGDTTNSEGNTLCNIFPWVDVGLMGGLWAFMAISQIYFYVMLSSYSRRQLDDHNRYSAFEATKPLASDIPMDDRSDPWNTHDSADSLAHRDGRYGHHRDLSSGSTSTIMADRQQQPVDGLGKQGYGSYGAPAQPDYAYTHEPTPTPHAGYQQYNDMDDDAGMNRPERMQAHPAEGSFRRKTPRKPSADYGQRYYYGPSGYR